LLCVKHVSSPIGKIITVKEVFKKLIPGENYVEADFVQKIMLYSLVKLGKRGADFYIDYQYIETFSPEAIQYLIHEYSFIT
jgi:hypothetical protein